MHSHFLFFGNVAAHLVALMSGVASFLIGLYEKGKNRPIATRAFWAIAVLCLLFAFDQAWQDEHRNTQQVITDKSEISGKFTACDKERAVLDASLKSSQSSLWYQQSRNDGQQDLFNKCILSLGAGNKREPLVLKAQWVVPTPAGEVDPSNKTIATVVIATTNQIAPANTILRCDKPFSFANAGLAGIHSLLNRGSRSTSKNEAIVEFDIGTWSPDHPMVIFVAGIRGEQYSCTINER